MPANFREIYLIVGLVFKTCCTWNQIRNMFCIILINAKKNPIINPINIEKIVSSIVNNAEFKISGRNIGANHLPILIAEIGINHGGDLKVAKEMVLSAKRAGMSCASGSISFK